MDDQDDSRIRVLVVDDHPLLREGISAVLRAEPDMEVAGEASNGREAIQRFREQRPNVTLMDIQMPEVDGVEAIIAIRAECPSARIIMLTTYKGDAHAFRALKAGASGYLLKSMIRTELLEAIRAVHAGQRRIPREVAEELAAHVADDALSNRELQVLRRVAAGSSNRCVGSELFVSEDTIKAHMKNIMGKLSAKDRTHAVTLALKRGIINI